uniref:Putative secreted protein n=1 Tax=Ixodes ricinus TaxID=34613 RepID=A0A6B0TXZ4_IXORI
MISTMRGLCSSTLSTCCLASVTWSCTILLRCKLPLMRSFILLSIRSSSTLRGLVCIAGGFSSMKSSSSDNLVCTVSSKKYTSSI